MISDLVKRLGQLDPSKWAEAAAVYKIVRTGGQERNKANAH